MLLSSLLLAVPLLNRANGIFDEYSITADPDYVIGDGYDLSWRPEYIESTHLDIVLYYGTNMSSSWTVATVK